MRKIILVAVMSAVVILLVGLVAFTFSVPHLVVFSSDTSDRTVELRLKSSDRTVFVLGMVGCENLCLDQHSRALFVTDLTGRVYRVDGPTRALLSVVKSRRIAERNCLGVDIGPDSMIYVGATDGEWQETGGAIWRVDPDLSRAVKVAITPPGLNGVAFDDSGELFFVTGNMDLVTPDGAIYRVRFDSTRTVGTPEIVIPGLNGGNGLHWNKLIQRMYVTDFTGVLRTDSAMTAVEQVYRKAKTFEFSDDLCVDSDGRLWIADPGNSFVKMYDPTADTIVRFVIDGLGQASACAIREEDGEEILYVTELKKPGNKLLSNLYDGRGVVSIPVIDLLSRLH
jgi:sugar lactone lactonase YvrE